jgi:hypothetical protein
MIDLSEKYRLKALASEQRSRDEPILAVKAAWAEIAIEWHTLANRALPGFNQDQELMLV